ncbi:MAG: hypothetical protein AAF531_10510 [Actinomycetota bacterium]
MVVLIALCAVGGVAGGGWWLHRRGMGGEGDDLKLPGSREIIRGIRSDLVWLDLLFAVIASASIVMLFSAGVIEVGEANPAGSIARQLLGGLLSALPALPLLVVGHFGASMFARPALPHDTDEVVADADRGPIRKAMAVGGLAFTGAALYGVYHLSNLTESLGFDDPLFGLIPPAWLIPFAVEILLLFILLAKMVRTADLAAVVPRAADSLAEEIQGDLDRLQLGVSATLARLDGEAKAAELQITANRNKRLAAQTEAIEGEKFKAERRTRKERAELAAARELELDELEASVLVEERRHDAEDRIAALAAKAEERKQLRAMQTRQREFDQDALDSLAGDQEQLAIAKARNNLELEQARHAKEIADARKTEKLPKALAPVPDNRVVDVTAPSGTNGTGDRH